MISRILLNAALIMSVAGGSAAAGPSDIFHGQPWEFMESVGGVAIGWRAIGGLAVGNAAVGGLAIGRYAYAGNGVALGRDEASGKQKESLFG